MFQTPQRSVYYSAILSVYLSDLFGYSRVKVICFCIHTYIYVITQRKLNRRVEKRLADIYEKDEKSKARLRQHDEGSTPMSRRSSKVTVIHAAEIGRASGRERV